MILTTLLSGKTIATIEGDTHIGKWAIESGRLDHDQNMLPLLRPFIPEGGTLIDVGAYIGDHTVFYADRVGEKGGVIAIEPGADAFRCLAFNTQHLAQVTALNAGASNTNDRMGLAIAANGGASHAIPNGTIPTITIDSLNLSACDFIKFDCEGMEPKAISGAWETIKAHQPTMLIEVNTHALARQGFDQSSIFDMLNELGYTYWNIYANQPMKGEQFDIICTHP